MAIQNLVARDVSNQVALDARSLSDLKRQAKSAPGEALRGAAGQFEALFLQMLLKSMRDALPQDGPFSSDTTKTYTAMFDQQMAQQLAKKGVGVADLLVKQLTPRTAVGASTAPTSTSAAPVPARAAPTPRAASTVTGAAPATATADTWAATATRIAAGATSLSDTAREFIEKMRPHAEAAAQAAGIPAAFLLAQAALETGWGRHQPRAADGTSSNNLFGIKAGSAWKGAKAVAATTEYVAGKAVTALESFRSYGSYTEAFADFAKLIRGNPRYAGVVANAGDGAAYARSLQQAGYATDPRYAEKLARTIETVARHAGGPDTQVLRAPAVKSSGSA